MGLNDASINFAGYHAISIFPRDQTRFPEMISWWK